MSTEGEGVFMASAIEGPSTDSGSFSFSLPAPFSVELGDVGFTSEMNSQVTKVEDVSKDCVADLDKVVHHAEEQPRAADDSQVAAVLTDDLCNKIIKQAEYYFSDESLLSNTFLMSFVKKGKDGFVPIKIIASFKKMKNLITEIPLIVEALRQSSQLVVSSNGKMVKRLRPLASDDSSDPKLCTILVENFPEEHSNESLENMFGEVGKIKDIRIRYPNASDEFGTSSMNFKTLEEFKRWDISANIIISKVHAFIEYENAEAAENAEATFNNKDNWRKGIRVRVLNKLMRRQTQTRAKGSGHSGGDGEDHNHGCGGDHAPDESGVAAGRRSHQQQGVRSWKQKHHSSGGGHHGYASVAANHEAAKPSPGRPRMPDGTRGFALGRGRPPALN